MQNLFSYPVFFEDFSTSGKTYNIVANARQLACIKDILQVQEIKKVEAEVSVKLKKKEHKLEVKGRVQATLELQSVVSLENFCKDYDIRFSMLFDTKMTAKEQDRLAAEGEDVPDILKDGGVDLGDIIIEQIALNLEDYPRKEGEVFEYKCDFSSDEVAAAPNPFEVLRKLK